MEVKPGYKQTEVGVIPEDWDVKPLGRLLGGPPAYGINAPAVSFDTRLPTYLRITDITEDGRFTEVDKASVAHSSAQHYILEPGDIVFARTGASVGKSYRYRSNDGKLVFAGFLIRIRPDNGVLDSSYLSFFAQGRPYWNWVNVNSMRSGQPGINGREYASLPIPLPPTKAEQEAIAEALSDADGLIESLEQLLAKKRQIKHGAMQELLTGHKRLPGFSGEWEMKRLRDCLLSNPDYGINAAAVPYSDRLPTYIRITDISEAGRFHANPRVSVRSTIADQYLLNEGDVVFARTGASVGKAYCYRVEDGPLVFAGFLIRVRPNPEVLLPMFLAAFANTASYWNWVRLMSMRSGQPGINGNEYGQLPIHRPPIAEQSAIAAILSDMDTEIAALESKLAKARQIKQGMMQELLTGRIRLV